MFQNWYTWCAIPHLSSSINCCTVISTQTLSLCMEKTWLSTESAMLCLSHRGQSFISQPWWLISFVRFCSLCVWQWPRLKAESHIFNQPPFLATSTSDSPRDADFLIMFAPSHTAIYFYISFIHTVSASSPYSWSTYFTFSSNSLHSFTMHNK